MARDVAPPEAADVYDGVSAGELARRLAVPRLSLFARVTSTMDVAHALAAEGAPAGTLVLADTQTGGRGRAGRTWDSPPGQGIWCTLVERPRDAGPLGVLSLRIGLHAAAALEPLADAAVAIKWPNDLLVAGRKLAGILVEARWRDGTPEWVAIGFGLNVRAPAHRGDAAGLGARASRLGALEALLPALRSAAAVRAAELGAAELAAYATRDAVIGRRVVAPVRGVVRGVRPAGELEVVASDGSATFLRQATLQYAD
jgi:BirA family biotin operon repressor/biotin-[acetyl-CoA-carboxylase] ligase